MTLIRPIRRAPLIFLLGFAAAFVLAKASAQEATPGNEATRVRGQRETGVPFPVAPPAQNGASPPVVLADQGIRGPNVPGEPINLLWITPLASLAPTRERPIFTPSRRPPTVRAVAPAPPPPSNDEPRKPPFVLLGAIHGDDADVAYIRDEATKIVIRLKTGESYLGWTLQAVKRREATLKNQRATAILELPPFSQTDPKR